MNALIIGAVMVIVTVLIALAVMGTGPFHEFITVIMPTLGRSFVPFSNQSLEGFAIRVMHVDDLPGAWARVLLVIRIVTLLPLLAIVVLRRKPFWTNSANVLAASAALMLWMLIFSPIYWEHYLSYVGVFFGWLIWEASRDRLRRIIVIATVPLLYVPWFVIPSIRPHLFEPVGSHMLWGTLLMWTPALMRLAAPTAEHSNEPEAT